MEKERHVLVILPHPDDETYMAGTLAAYIHQGAPVTYVCLTLGEMGRNMGNPLFANRVTLPEIRKKELEASARAIGIQDLRRMGLLDKTIEFEDQELLIRNIGSLIEELKPSLILTFYPGYSVHPDHDATGRAVIRTVERLPEAKRPKVYCAAFSKGCREILGQPDITNDVTNFLAAKVASFQAHRSQFQLMAFLDNKSFDDPELQKRLGREQFWTYRFG
ncbi:bacillithiol biosynthesis deacetylase BshB2 [Paenibacillus rigui]|uniref:Bacillithiol biosynthesis deacetylase BshB2 n=1 Tax=Paenibacillus rigui TaxID=554312 RepID=A0A229ULQ2_9BACL|nr:bacillithiol biosynthesis deacetylase BshB2 [Paenibacillus rigui]OXM84302.1 bacillithiol biosynthesis deacetylase BshB2 [Paenibacillus rigui]